MGVKKLAVALTRKSTYVRNPVGFDDGCDEGCDVGDVGCDDG